MNKTELIAAAAEGAGLTKKDTERVINAAIDAVTAALVKGDKVQVYTAENEQDEAMHIADVIVEAKRRKQKK